MDVDCIQSKLSEKTYRFQILSFIVLGLIYARGSWNTFGVLFLAGEVGHSCDFEDPASAAPARTTLATPSAAPMTDAAHRYKYTTNTGNNASRDWGLTTMPASSHPTIDNVVVARKCDVLVAAMNGTNTSIPCTTGWIYRKREEKSSIVSEVRVTTFCFVYDNMT